MIYFISNGLGQVKIGYSLNPSRRLKDLQTASPNQLELLAILPGDQVTETEYHSKYADCNIGGEWFEFSFDLQIEIEAIAFVYGIEPTKEDLALYNENFIAWERETSKIEDEYDVLTSEIEKQIDELEKKIDDLTDEKDKELLEIERKYPFTIWT